MTLFETDSVTDIDRRTRALLPRVSRTFALGVKMLPARLEVPVRLGYLLCRIADTVEDDLALGVGRKVELLDAFASCFEDAAAANAFGASVAELTANADYLELVAQTGEVFMLYRTLDATTQAILKRWIGEMVVGMRRVVLDHPDGIRLGTVADFRTYCYYVAGTVGHLLTELWQHHSSAVDARIYARLLEDCEAFGLALQTVNILKDIPWDAEHENAIYIPSELLMRVGSEQTAILRDDVRSANLEAIRPLIHMANDALDRAVRYIENLPLSALRVRFFCALPVLFAIATMREIERTDAMLHPGGSVKISRAEVKALIVASSTSTLTNRSLRWLVERVRDRPFSFALGA